MSADRDAEVRILVRDLSQALRAHVEAEAKRLQIAPKDYCPCVEDELVRAAAFLDEDDPEPVQADDPEDGPEAPEAQMV